MNSALRILFAILRRNRGLPYPYILGRLPRANSPTFVVAASRLGLGGFHCTDYFIFGHDDLRDIINRCPGWETYPQVPIERWSYWVNWWRYPFSGIITPGT